jgi:hypothetical protein
VHHTPNPAKHDRSSTSNTSQSYSFNKNMRCEHFPEPKTCFLFPLSRTMLPSCTLSEAQADLKICLEANNERHGKTKITTCAYHVHGDMVSAFDFYFSHDAFVHYHYQDEHISLNHTNANDIKTFSKCFPVFLFLVQSVNVTTFDLVTFVCMNFRCALGSTTPTSKPSL